MVNRVGDLAFAVRERYPNAHVSAFDFSEGILREGARKGAQRSDAQRYDWAFS